MKLQLFITIHYSQVPEKLRVGPWNTVMPFFIVLVIAGVVYMKPESILEQMETVSVYPEPYSNWWYYNLFAGIWMSSFILYCLSTKVWIITTYTIQSWIYLSLRHCLTALAPFLTQGHFLVQCNEFLRFPSLATATITFTLWNFLIAPIIYILMETPKKKHDFVLFNLSFRLIQLHVFNIVFAILNNISVSPRRSFTYSDLWCSIALAAVYLLFYMLILDRLGVHLYPMFSPRFKFVIGSISSAIGLYYVCFLGWNKAIKNGTFALDE